MKKNDETKAKKADEKLENKNQLSDEELKGVVGGVEIYDHQEFLKGMRIQKPETPIETLNDKGKDLFSGQPFRKQDNRP